MINVLFVCSGNTCRSPMAEAILKNKNIPGVEVRSAGVFAQIGMEASPYAKEVLAENQISHRHISKKLSKEDIQWATYIFTMTTGHKEMVIERYQDVAEKTFTLKEFISHNDKDVVDPFGGSVEIYRETYQELKELIDRALMKLK